jgi:hypothetical protein
MSRMAAPDSDDPASRSGPAAAVVPIRGRAGCASSPSPPVRPSECGGPVPTTSGFLGRPGLCLLCAVKRLSQRGHGERECEFEWFTTSFPIWMKSRAAARGRPERTATTSHRHERPPQGCAALETVCTTGQHQERSKINRCRLKALFTCNDRRDGRRSGHIPRRHSSGAPLTPRAGDKTAQQYAIPTGGK